MLIQAKDYHRALRLDVACNVQFLFRSSIPFISSFLAKNIAYKRVYDMFMNQLSSAKDVPSINDLANMIIFLCDVLQKSHPENLPPFIILIRFSEMLNIVGTYGHSQEVMEDYGFFLKRILLENPHCERAIIFGAHILRLPGFNDTSHYSIVDFSGKISSLDSFAGN